MGYGYETTTGDEMTSTIKDVQAKGYGVNLTNRTVPCTEITHKEAFCLLWRSGQITASDDMGDHHRVVLDGPHHENLPVAFEIMSDAQLRGRGHQVPERRVWNGKGFDTQPQEPKLLFEDMNYTVEDFGPKLGVRIEFVGMDFEDTETFGSKWFLDAAAAQVREIIGNGKSVTIPARLERLVDYPRVWQTLDRNHTKFCREGKDGIIYVAKDKGEDGADQYWVQTQDEAGYPIGPRATAEVFNVAGAREEGRRLAEMALQAPTP